MIATVLARICAIAPNSATVSVCGAFGSFVGTNTSGPGPGAGLLLNSSERRRVRTLLRPIGVGPTHDEIGEAREPWHRVTQQERRCPGVKAPHDRDPPVVPVTEESYVLLNDVPNPFKPSSLRRRRPAAPAIVRGELAVLDRVARTKEPKGRSRCSLGEQEVCHEGERVERRIEMKCQAAGPQQRAYVPVKGARPAHVLGEHLGNHEVKGPARWCCVAADVRDDLVVSGRCLRQFLRRHVEQTVPKPVTGEIVKWQSRIRSPANLADAPAAAGLDQPHECCLIAGEGFCRRAEPDFASHSGDFGRGQSHFFAITIIATVLARICAIAPNNATVSVCGAFGSLVGTNTSDPGPGAGLLLNSSERWRVRTSPFA